MLIEFNFSNFRSFRDQATLSLLAANITSDPKSVDDNNLILALPGLNLLTSAIVYGANASGKSNLVAAIAFMRNWVLNSSRQTQAENPIDVEPFRLSIVSEGQPSTFEVVFLVKGGQKYRYGFEVTSERVVREWLYITSTIREARLFVRQGDQIEVNPRSFREGRGLEKRTRSDALFLSVVAEFNGPTAKLVQAWFRRLGIISGLSDVGYQGYTINKLMHDLTRSQQIKQFVCALDLDIEDIQVEKVEPSEIVFPKNIPEDIKAVQYKGPGEKVVVRTTHKKYDADQNPLGVELFTLEGNESEGTKKLVYLSGPILDTLISGRVLVIDEMEARMHPLITAAIIRYFNSLESNPKRSQLIVTTHDTNLLHRDLFRRDQVWFTEKDRFGASHLYSLVEFKPRNDASFEKDYLLGRYGAVPYPVDLSSAIHAFLVGEEKGKYDA